MQVEDIKNTIQSDFAGNLFDNYHYFYDGFYTLIRSAVNEFLNSDLGLKLISVSENENVLFLGEEYFVTKVKVTRKLSLVLRISKSAVAKVLDVILGKKDAEFSLDTITELEVKVLTSFNDHLYKSFEGNLLSGKDINYKKHENDLCHMTFLIKTGSEEVGKIIASIPVPLFPHISEKPLGYSFGLETLADVPAAVNIEVGKTKTTLKELREIEHGDLVLLEDSDITKMTVISGDIRKRFRINPNPSLITSIDEDENSENGGNIMADTKNNANMWDSIQVDLSAEFEQVKMPLGDLRQISEGLVVDIGSVYENRLDLKVENKVIASGELVIINDRYGVRVDKIYNDSELEDDNRVQPASSVQKAPEASVAEAKDGDFKEEDFDYSNFDIEDEEI